ncbi:MAG: nucleotidyltransferase domain-containing protein [Nanoarchaeota archaeon]|nr:nucleotidyltransferase domain-containing protein [Nanoarchaeota archaeon]
MDKGHEKKPKSLGSYISSSNNSPKPPIAPALTSEDFDKIKQKLEIFKKAILKKFPFTRSLGILPAKAYPMFEEEEIPQEMQEEVSKTKPMHIIMIIPEEEYKNIAKIKPEVISIAKETGEKLWVHIKTEVDLWNYGLDSKFSFMDAVSASIPLHDSGFLGSLRVANIHKSLVLNRFDRYIASYVIAGSLVRGTADETSDVDVFVVIDDTDVKRMSRIELLERLRGIIFDYIKEATALAGVKNILNVQVYLLTDFWQSVKDAQPIMFTFIRDGVPLYDRGTFLPWKRLLLMGRIKPSPEAIDQYMKEGEKTDEFVKRRLLDTMVDIYFGVVTPTQALMMLAGHAPPVPKNIVNEVKSALVDKEKVMSEKELKTLEKAVKYYKDYEHGKLKEITGREIDDLKKESEGYLKKLKAIREKLEMRMQEHLVENLHVEMEKMLKHIFGNKTQKELLNSLETELVKKGKLSPRMGGIANDILKIKVKAKSKKLTQTEMQRISRDSSDLINALVEYQQRKELVSVEKGVIQISYSGKKGELVLTDHGSFFVTESGIKKIENKSLVNSDKKQLEEALSKTRDRLQVKLSSDVLQLLKKELGDFEIIL